MAPKTKVLVCRKCGARHDQMPARGACSKVELEISVCSYCGKSGIHNATECKHCRTSSMTNASVFCDGVLVEENTE